MITDQRQTGVPNGNAFKTQGINQRTQLVKPNQVGNIGRSMPQNQNLAPALKQMQQFNPVQAAPQQSNAASTASQQTPAQTPDYLFRTAEQGPVVPNTPSPIDQVSQSVTLNPSAQQIPQSSSLDTELSQKPVQMDIDIARDALRRMSDRDIITLLDELGTGSLRGGQY